MNPDDPLEQLKALKAGGGSGTPPGGDPLDQLKAMKASSPPPTGNAAEGVVQKGLNTATLGLNEPLVGIASAIGNVARHGIYAHPIDTYKNTTNQIDQDIQAADAQHPYLSAGAGAVGFGATLAADAPIRALLGLPEAAVATEEGVRGAVKRILGSAKTGAATGAVVSGIGARGTPGQQVGQVVGGGLLGGVLGGGAQTAGEVTTGAENFLRSVMQPVDEKAGNIVDRRVLSHLGINNLTPSDVQANAQQAVQTGSPSTLAHLGGPALDPLTYLGASSSSPAGSQLKTTIQQAQRGEQDLLQRGVSAMSGVPDSPDFTAESVLGRLEDYRKGVGRTDYSLAYAEPPVTDPRVLKAVADEPYLSDALDQSVDILGRRSRADALRTGQPQPTIMHPLQGAQASPTGQAAQLASLYQDDPVMHAIARKAAGLPPLGADPTGAIPVQMLDKLQQAAQPGIEVGLKRGKLAAEDAGAINSQVQSILQMAGEGRPAFAKARARQAEMFGQHDAATAGQTAFDQSPEMIGAKLADLSPTQANAYRMTATSGLRDMLSSNGYTTNVEKTVLDNPDMQEQLSALYGDNAAQLNPYQTQARSLNRVASEATGGSQTEPRAQIRREIVDQGGNDVLNTILAPKRGFWNAPGKLLDAKNKQVQDAVLNILAKRLNMPAGSQSLQDYIQQLQTPARTRYGPLGAPASSLGILSGLLSSGAGQ